MKTAKVSKAAKPVPAPQHPAFQVDRATFVQAVGKVARIASESPPVPVLRGILITVSPGSVELVTTDYEQTGIATLPADFTEAGRILVDAAMLAKICRHLDGPTVDVETNGQWLFLVCGPSTYTLLSMPEEDFPTSRPNPVDLKKVRAAPASSLERELAKGERFHRDLTTLWRAPRSTRVYEPGALDVGATIVLTIDGTERQGQIWHAPKQTLSGWALVDDGDSNTLVQFSAYRDGTLVYHAPTPQPATTAHAS